MENSTLILLFSVNLELLSLIGTENLLYKNQGMSWWGIETVNCNFYLVDVFGQKRFTGNQLAVVIHNDDLTDIEMQKIANEFHFSETTFVSMAQQPSEGYIVRIFTPATEVPFAGHPTLGTAYVINNLLAKQPAEEVTLNLKVGKITVTFEKIGEKKSILWMRQIQPAFGKAFQKDLFEKILGLSSSDFDPSYPIQEVSTGLPFIIVPLKTLESVKHARVDKNILPDLTKQTQAGILVFAPQTCYKENSLHVRVFVDAFGIPEDPATGSGNGCLAAYLSKYQYLGASDINIKVEQGFEINRPSILHLKTQTNNRTIAVQVGGQVQLIAKGELVE